MGSRKGRWLVTAGLLLVCALGALAWLAWPHERLLLPKATFIAKTDAWQGGERFNWGIERHWLSDKEVLFSRFEGANHRDRVIYKRNIQTGIETKLSGLTQSRDDLFAENTDAENVSPDGKWFLCSERWGDCLLAEVDGKRHTLYPSQDSGAYRSFYWMADSRHWLEEYRNGEAHKLVLHDVQRPKFSQRLPIGDKSELFAALAVVLSMQQAIAILREQEFKPDDQPLSHDSVTVCHTSLNARAAPAAQREIAIPHESPDAQLLRNHCVVSPQGDRIAWEVRTQRQKQMPSWLNRLLPSVFKPHSRQQVELWVCNLDGSHMHEIGHIPEPPAKDAEDTDGLWLSTQWLPGGKRLSFEYKDALYTVSAE